MAKFKYVGDGASHLGIPAKDISSDDLSEEQLQVVKESSLYREVRSSKAKKDKKEVKDERINKAQEDSTG